jgi:hypothetical protein
LQDLISCRSGKKEAHKEHKESILKDEGLDVIKATVVNEVKDTVDSFPADDCVVVLKRSFDLFYYNWVFHDLPIDCVTER